MRQRSCPFLDTRRSKSVGNVIAVRVKQDVAKYVAEVVFLPTFTGLNPCVGKVFTVEMHSLRGGLRYHVTGCGPFPEVEVRSRSVAIKRAAAIVVLAQVLNSSAVWLICRAHKKTYGAA